MLFERRMEGLKKPRETKFGDPEITNDEQAIEILREAQLGAMEAGVHGPGNEKVSHAIEYLQRRLREKVAKPEQEQK